MTPLSAMCVPIVKRLLKVPEVSEIIRANTTSLLKANWLTCFQATLVPIVSKFSKRKKF